MEYTGSGNIDPGPDSFPVSSCWYFYCKFEEGRLEREEEVEANFSLLSRVTASSFISLAMGMDLVAHVDFVSWLLFPSTRAWCLSGF